MDGGTVVQSIAWLLAVMSLSTLHGIRFTSGGHMGTLEQDRVRAASSSPTAVHSASKNCSSVASLNLY